MSRYIKINNFDKEKGDSVACNFRAFELARKVSRTSADNLQSRSAEWFLANISHTIIIILRFSVRTHKSLIGKLHYKLTY